MVTDDEVASFTGANLILTHGIAGCGKSTWATRMIALNSDNIVNVSRDDLRFEVYGDDYFSEPNRLQEKTLDAMQVERIQEYLKVGKTVIVDDTNIKPWVVWRLVKAGLSAGLDIGQIYQRYFDVPIDVVIAQNENRSKSGGRLAPITLIKEMHQLAYASDNSLKRQKITKDGIIIDGRIYRDSKEGEPIS